MPRDHCTSHAICNLPSTSHCLNHARVLRPLTPAKEDPTFLEYRAKRLPSMLGCGQPAPLDQQESPTWPDQFRTVTVEPAWEGARLGVLAPPSWRRVSSWLRRHPRSRPPASITFAGR